MATKLDDGLRRDGAHQNDWHLWERHPHGDKWMGFFTDEHTALAWVRKHPGNYVINNVPPTTSRRYAQTEVGDLRPIAPVVPSPVRVVEPQRSQRRAVIPRTRTERPAVATEQMILRNTAKKRLDKHKKDEATDLKEGKSK